MPSLVKLTLGLAVAFLASTAAAASTATAGDPARELAFVRGGDTYAVRTDGSGLRRLIGTNALEH